MKLVILGVGGMGAITLSKLIAQMCINKGLSVKSSEIHGMAKKGGLVEIQMKINEGTSGVVLQREADLVILLKEDFVEYAKAFAGNRGKLFVLKDEIIESFVKEIGGIRYLSSFILGVFTKLQDYFDDKDAMLVINNMPDREKNMLAFKKGVAYDF